MQSILKKLLLLLLLFFNVVIFVETLFVVCTNKINIIILYFNEYCIDNTNLVSKWDVIIDVYNNYVQCIVMHYYKKH